MAVRNKYLSLKSRQALRTLREECQRFQREAASADRRSQLESAYHQADALAKAIDDLRTKIQAFQNTCDPMSW